LTNWGVFSEETTKALIASVLNREQLYENTFRQPNTAVSSQVETLLNWLLDQKVLILEPVHIRNYLTRHFDLTRILRSTCKLALDRFGMQSQIALKIYSDPEVTDEYLTLYIRQSQYSETILKSIADLRAEYEEDLTDSSGWFLVTTDFHPPL
jgi:hypothetical protein